VDGEDLLGQALPPALATLLHRLFIGRRRVQLYLGRRSRYPDGVLQFLAVTQVLIVVALITLILMHSGRDAGMGGMGFTPASQGGTHIVERNLTRVTLVFAVLFFVNSVALFHYLK
jgi:preprotein translocase subunit SecG